MPDQVAAKSDVGSWFGGLSQRMKQIARGFGIGMFDQRGGEELWRHGWQDQSVEEELGGVVVGVPRGCDSPGLLDS